jgi:dipeptidyl aminopeptidase/acylaminoacyl peptidase
MTKTAATFFLVTMVAAAATVRGEPNTRRPLAEIMTNVARATNYLEIAISPNARWTAWTQSTAADARAASAGSAIFLRSAGHSNDVLRVTARPPGGDSSSALQEKALAWAPDSSALAFLSDAQTPGQLQLYVMRLGDHSIQRLTDLKGFLATPGWSPDGNTIALLFTENATRAAGPLEAVAQEVGVIGQKILEQRIATVDLGTGSVRQVSPADLYVYEYDWSPDGSTFAVTAAHGSGDNNWYVAEIYLIDRSSGAARSVLKPDMQIAAPRWSADGKTIAFIGGLMSDESIASGDVYVMAASGGKPRNLTAQHASSTFWLTWLPKSQSILLAAAVDGGSGLVVVDSRTGAVHTLWQGAETMRGPDGFARGVSMAADGKTTAVIRESFNEPSTLWLGPTGAWRALTNSSALDSSPPWGKAESVRWSSDQFSVQGWLVPPANIVAGQTYPMVVWVHGGPAWVKAPAWATQIDYATLLASQGYFVFFPNPRGSAGFGEQFKRANVKDFGGGDLRDILGGVRQLVATHPIDDHRIGITGWSYGGYMAMWAVTQTDRFRAAVAGAGGSDLLSYYGENGIDEWLIPYFGASVYDDPAVYAKSSPINFVKHAHTPTLLIVGENDVEGPPPQSYEFWHALKTLNVKTELVIYAHEGHEFSDPADVLDRLQRIVTWFDENMPPQPQGSSAQ